jgi:hypothetical protein
MAKFTILTPAAASFTTSGGGYDYELEALEGMGVEIIECQPTEKDFIAKAGQADAVYAKGMQFNAKMIKALKKCRIIALGSVGVDYVDVAAATAQGIPVTNCPDTFIEEVADQRFAPTDLGRLVVNALGLHPEEAPLFEVLDTDLRSSDPLAFARVVGRIAALDRPLVVDPYCRRAQLEYLVTHTSVNKVLVSDRLSDEDVDDALQ